MQLTDAAQLGRTLLDEHGLTDWRLVFDRAKRRAGICRPDRREIGLSGPLTQLHPDHEVRDTILHEIAHALVGPGHGHDAVWRAAALRIGCSGQRCTDVDAPSIEGDWVGVCSAGHRVSRHRRPDRPASCTRCRSGFDVAHLLTWSHRGQQVRMSPTYDAHLRRLLAAPSPSTQPGVRPRPARVSRGDRLRITAPGRYFGLVGRLVKRGRTRYHLDVDGRVLTVPFALVEVEGETSSVG